MLDSQWSQEDRVRVCNIAVELMKVTVADNAHDFPQVAGSHILMATMPGSTWETRIHDHDQMHA